ncbi:MAG: ABC transporter permease, partial [Terriglobales bacterium]
MRWITIVRRRFRSLLRRGAAERELEAELNLHLERLIAANLADGLTPGEARRQALVSFGGIEPLKEASRDVRQTGRVFDCMRDLRHGLRLLRKSPGFTAFAVLTLALGIGANIAVFTVINAAMLRPLPVPGADALVTVSQHIRGTISRDVHDDATFVSYSEYRQYAKDNRVFSGLAAYLPFVDTTLGSTEHRPVLGALTSCNYFDVLELHPARGRFFRGADCGAAGTGAVVVLSDALWRQAFDRDPQMVGKSIVLNRTRFTVIGVAAPGFAGTQPVASAFWAPVTMAHAFHPEFDYLGDNNMSWLALIGRLKPGLTRGQAGANLNVIATRFNALQAGRITTVSLGYATLASTTAMGEVMAIIGGIILAAVGLVLLMACANLAGFILARGESRRKEIAVRLALGAGRGRIIRQLFAESLLLAIFGGAAGGLAAAWSTDSLFRLALARLPIAPEFTSSLRLTPDLRTLLFAFGMALVTACAFGLAPALQASRAELATAMKEGSGQVHSAGASAGRRQRWLVGAQVAVCMILLLAAGLLLHALVNALHPRLGFETANIEAVALDLADAGYDQARGMAFDRQLQDRVAALPGVEGVAEATLIPLSGSDDETGLSLPGGGPALQVHFNSATPNFFPLLGIAILRGRNFTPVEAQTGAHVLIVSRETARRLWPNQDPIGKLARFGGSRGSLCQVVGG